MAALVDLIETPTIPVSQPVPVVPRTSSALGIDIGGSGIKGAVVDVRRGEYASDFLQIPTPSPSTPRNVAEVVAQIAERLSAELGDGPVGVTIPAIVRHGVTCSAANIDSSWIDAPAQQTFQLALGREVTLVNDADAAGVAEVTYGAARNASGMVIVTTLGTGIGSALIHDGVLIPNTELGHLELDGLDAEVLAAASARARENLSFEAYVPRLQRYFGALDFLFSPDLIVVGGGVSEHSEKFLPQLRLNCPVVPAALQNSAGIIGAARMAGVATASTLGHRWAP
ncbi:polyphosphate--glucose phosphotransferase [Raineyella fluvialis]|uniref:ROK family protein n=1 Tax=Raineyella fluvialis TaxID=2662261 RepID=A0A5Q2F873_9ACTN|nr:ROK family protein [Raineyella fluvialis]QGF23029.1 ROK family protein [Raineyella fluvialis]